MKKLLPLLIFTFCFGQGMAQVGELESGDDWKDRIYIGGGLGLQFGNITNIQVSPIVGYRINEKLSAGIGITYIYYKIKFDNGQEFETDIYGGSVFVRRNLNEQFFLQAEYESLNLEFYNVNDGSVTREWVPGLLLGGGYFMPLGRHAGFSATALYNVIHDDLKSPYNSPLILRIGFTVGF
ncbi:MAG: hypothetical protein ABJH05_06405 [Fulvivirga sp.]